MRKTGVNFHPSFAEHRLFVVVRPELEPRLAPKAGAFHCAKALVAQKPPIQARSLFARAVGHRTTRETLRL
jgi:hypothetical protein